MLKKILIHLDFEREFEVPLRKMRLISTWKSLEISMSRSNDYQDYSDFEMAPYGLFALETY